ncbi:hypothetical protein LINGRAHAP2_LOCUS37079 [Linum grandiflorum]
MVVGIKIFLTRNKGFHLFAGSSGLLFDIKKGFTFKGIQADEDEAVSQPQKSAPREYISRNDLKSPDKIMNHLADHGAHVQSVHIFNPKYPDHMFANSCDRVLQMYAERLFEERRDLWIPRKMLEEYCGIVVKQ